MKTIASVIKYLETLYPKQLAYDKDPIGLQLGNVNAVVTNILVTLDVTEAVILEAIEKKVNFIVAHHPFIFRPLVNLNTQTPKGRVIELAIKHDICIYSMHTNYDIAPNGMNDELARYLELTHTRPLVETSSESYAKIMIYTPVDALEAVKTALGEAKAGPLGDSSHCSFTTPGTGPFKPLEGANPTIGRIGDLEHVEEVKVEVLAKSSDVNQIIAAVKAVHPYEVMAYDVFKQDIKLDETTYGIGRIGELEAPMQMSDYIERVKQNLNIKHARFIGTQDKLVKRVAVIGGSGSGYASAAKRAKADLYVTGDIGFHDGCDALDMGLNILDVGHHAECIMKPHVAAILREVMTDEHEVFASDVSTEPFQFV